MVFERRRIFQLTCCFLLLVPASLASGQSQLAREGSAVPTHDAFDVVSIRPSAKEGYSHWKTGPDGYFATNVTVRQLMVYAYYKMDESDGFNNILSGDQIRDLPGWADAAQFDVTAKVDEQIAAGLSRKSYRERASMYGKLLQSVLRERFNLDIRHEKRAQPVYLLLTSRDGSKLVESNVPPSQSSLSVGRAQIRATAYRTIELASQLTSSLGRFVVDQTHLTGVYDFQLRWRADNQADTEDESPQIFTAIKEQLGLVLVPSKGPVDTIVVLRLERPTSN